MEAAIFTLTSSFINLSELDTSQASGLQIHALEKLISEYNPVKLMLWTPSGLDAVGDREVIVR